jgi:DNA-directed RNA polymerase
MLDSSREAMMPLTTDAVETRQSDPETKLLGLLEPGEILLESYSKSSKTSEGPEVSPSEGEDHPPSPGIHLGDARLVDHVADDAVWRSLTETQKEWLKTEQQQLVIDAVDEGVRRYRSFIEDNTKRGERSELTPERRLILGCMETLVPAIKKLQKAAVSGKALRGVQKWGVPILSLEPDKLALITLNVAVNHSHSMDGDNTFTKACDAVARAVKREREFSLVKQNAPDVLKELSKKTKVWDARNFRRLKVKSLAADVEWAKDVRMHLGAVLLDALVTNTTAFVRESICVGNRTVGIIRLTDEAKASLDSQHSNMEILRPAFYPCVCPPLRWTQHRLGGYEWNQKDMMKGGDGHNGTQNPEAPLVRFALDVVAHTPWRIAEIVRSTSNTLWARGGAAPGVPPAEPLPFPEKPAGYSSDSDLPEHVDWRTVAASIHGKNAENEGTRKVWLDRKRSVDRLKKFPALYFPHQLDWRTRAYPIPTVLNPQSDDHGRAILQFAEGKRLGDEGFRWLTIHLANCLGFDKAPFDQRIAEVHNLAAKLADWVADPIATEKTGWGEMVVRKGSSKPRWDDPWKVLVAASEWVIASRSRNPRDFVSHTRCEIDGSCNGLQHLSAMGLDPIGGRAVNLLPSQFPQDIYSEVKVEVERRVSADCLVNRDLSHPCHYWRNRIERDTVKRAVMTTPYGVTLAGIRSQFIADGHTADADKSIKLETQGGKKTMVGRSAAAAYLSSVVHDAVGTVVVAAREIMDWLQEVALLCAEREQPVLWTTPAGIKVTQEYLATMTKRIVTLQQEITLREPHPDRLFDVQKQVRSLPPNFVHSFDAAHMFLTTHAAYHQGVTSMGHVHDSFSTHACDIPILNRVLREQFVEMYKVDRLAMLKAEVEAETGVELTSPPARGALDINQFLDSPYGFH